MAKGTLFLIPVPLSDDAAAGSFTHLYAQVINEIDEYIVENKKTARKFLKQGGLTTAQSDLILHDYGKHNRSAINYGEMFASLLKGKDVGLMSEAGCPGVADPGADIVAEAHRQGIRVVPLVGPSSILLALMGSGFSGQNFSFHGYLPIHKSERATMIRALEQRSAKEGSTQLFIETPFRNNQLFSDLLKYCKAQTKLCIASELTSADEFIVTKEMGAWKTSVPDLHKKPTIFLLFAR